jgi:nucleoid-associated protein YgaU
MKRRRRTIPITLLGPLGDLERYGLLALIAAFVLGVAWLARALTGDVTPFEAARFLPTSDLSAERAFEAPAADAAGPEPDADAGTKLARATTIEPDARPAGRPGFDFFEPPARLPGRAAVVAPPRPGADVAARTITVKKGDTLQKIAARELGDSGRWRTLLQWNSGLDPKRLKPGQELKLPPPPRESPASAALAASVRTHDVERNETLQSLAERYYGEKGRWIDLLEANRDLLREPSALRAGMKIRIP